MRLFFNGFSVVRSSHWAPCASLGLLNLTFLGRCLPPRQMYPWWLRLQKHSILTGCARKPHLLRGYLLKSLQWLCFLIPMIVLQNPLPSRNEGSVLLVSRMQSVQCPQPLRQRCLPEAELEGNPSFSLRDRYSVTAIFFALALSDTRCF